MTKHFLRHTITFVLLFILQNQLHAQDKNRQGLHPKDQNRCGHNWVLTPAVHFSKHVSAEISFGRSYSWSSGGAGSGSHQFAIGSEFLFLNNQTILAPKFSYTATLVFAAVRANLLDYTSFNGKSSWQFRPELGLSIDGWLTVTYGYSFALSNKDLYPLKNSLNLLWPLYLPKRHFDKVI